MSVDAPPIKRLAEDVINRIAAGEIIQRPANALKELIENSLDAKSTNIQITVKNGGLKFLQIQDNGTGIRKEDFEIVCERFTTSKLREFEDLHKISTYGFRGEALASISHIAHLTITSKTKNDICAYQGTYIDGKLQSSPKPVAGNQGTIITVEDLFYNMNVRRKALKSPAEEYQKISDVVSKYSIHNSGIGFGLKKFNGNNDVKTAIGSDCLENIRLIYGSNIARELIKFEMENDSLQFKANGYITNVNYSTKKFQFLLFINNRLVQCQSLKKCIDHVYQTYLPKNAHPFVYLSLHIDPNNIDINVHPTKHEVHFLNEDQIVESIMNALETKLLGSNNSRVFYTQAKLPGIQFETKESLNNESKTAKSTKVVYAKDMVRTDSSIQKLDKFFGSSKQKSGELKNLEVSMTEEEFAQHNEKFIKKTEDFECDFLTKDDKPAISTKNMEKASQDILKRESGEKKEQCKMDESFESVDSIRCTVTKEREVVKDVEEANKKESEDIFTENTQILFGTSSQEIKQDSSQTKRKRKKDEEVLNKHFIAKITKVETKLTSILQLRKSIEDDCHKSLRETFAQHVYVGSISARESLIQHGTKLLLCNTKKILSELFYQVIMYNFQNFDFYMFAEPLSLYDLALLALNMPETGWTEEDGPKEELAKRIKELLMDKSAMLLDYFSLKIDESGCIKSVPILLENYFPNPAAIPMYALRLATEVNWDDEKECFETFARETAKFYSDVCESVDKNGKYWKWVTEHVLYPAIKQYFIPPRSFAQNAAVLEVADLPNLYKVFERC